MNQRRHLVILIFIALVLTGCVFKEKEMVEKSLLTIILEFTDEVQEDIVPRTLFLHGYHDQSSYTYTFQIKRQGDIATVVWLSPPVGYYEVEIEGTDGYASCRQDIGDFSYYNQPKTVTLKVRAFK